MAQNVIYNPWERFPGGSDCKDNACSAGDLGSIPGLGRSPGEGIGTPLQYSCLENPMDGGAWQATVHAVTERRDWVSHFTWEGTKGPDSAQRLHCCYLVSFDRFPLFQHFLLLWLNLLLTKVLHRQEAGRGHGGGRGSYGPAPFQRVSTRASVCAAPRVTRQQSMEWSLELQLMCVVLCGWSLLLLAYLMLFLTTFVSQGSNCSSLCTLFIYSWYSFHLSFKKCSCLGKMLIRVTDCLFPSVSAKGTNTFQIFAYVITSTCSYYGF